MDQKIYSFLKQVYVSNHNKKIHFLNEDYYNFVNKSESFKLFDYCSNYSICFSSKDVLNKCLNSPALFTITDQNIKYGSFALSPVYSLIVTIKCEYFNRNSTLSSYTFKVNLDHFTKHPHFINHISVNINGTVLLLSSDVACFLVNTPYELSKFAESDCNGCNLTLTEQINGNLLMKGMALNDNIHVVKASWNPVFSNAFVIVTNEYVRASSSGKDSEFVMDFSSCEYMSFIRIYNLDRGLEEPMYELSISERMCRLGQNSGSDTNFKFQKTRGRLVDIFINSNDKSSLGSFTLFALSNYGYMFCYCPIIMNTMYDFTKNTPLIKKCLELSKKGFKTKFGKQAANNRKTNSENGNNESYELKKFIANINKYLIGNRADLEFYPVVIRLLSNDFIPDCNLIYSYPVFESFMVLSTEPLIIIVSQSDSKISVYRPKLDLYPSTSTFYDASLLNAMHMCFHTECMDLDSKGKMSLKQLSQSDFLYYSRKAVYHFNYNNGLSFGPLFDQKQFSQSFYSEPILIKSNKRGKENNELAQLNDVLSIIITHEFNRNGCKNLELANSIMMTKYTQSDTAESSQNLTITYASTLTMPSLSATPNELEQIIKTNTDLFMKINNAKKMVNGYKEIFKSLKSSSDKEDMNEKSVEMIKGLAKLDSDVITNLELLPVYEKAVSEYVTMSNESSELIDDFFNETIDHYHTLFNQVKARIAKINERRKWMSARHSEIMQALLLYNSVKNVEDTVEQVSNMISEFHLRYSNIILSKFDEHMNSYTFVPSTLLNKTIEMDHWFYTAYKNNVDMMYKIYSRIKTIRTSMDTMI
ncbi:conserved hypothetical protein [Theileria orientalis strain Shintoku]|uniref:Uncharacterized protein n=1 Tax=Theileria orientalis strain Shintoku TaxID=869250 RepID=J4DAJ1_THEOR|nr:conserved hypothetical protein [Theileria orientalis strain Shintoku]BAM42020.1 conserved hypothetical protein [Theileria orientalis strain Shintoku]|eukprot:XP_009692321.1 conserved hypothetical protein [Theileria orientalis strain Shintoku]